MSDIKDITSSADHTNRPGKTDVDVINEFYETCNTNSKYALKIVKTYTLGVAYGDGPSQIFDIFYPGGYIAETRIVVYYHGGYWQQGSTSRYHFLGLPVTLSSNILVLVGVDLAPKGTITSIVQQCREAVGCVCKMFPNAERVTFCGHSSGGMEVAILASTPWESFNPSVAKYFKSRQIRFVLLCGVFELNHLINTSVNEQLNMTEKEATENSPINYVKNLAANQRKYGFKIALVEVQNDSPIITKSNLDYKKSLEKESIPFHYMYIENSDHFKILQDLFESGYCVTKILTEDQW